MMKTFLWIAICSILFGHMELNAQGCKTPVQKENVPWAALFSWDGLSSVKAGDFNGGVGMRWKKSADDFFQGSFGFTSKTHETTTTMSLAYCKYVLGKLYAGPEVILTTPNHQYTFGLLGGVEVRLIDGASLGATWKLQYDNVSESTDLHSSGDLILVIDL